MPLARIEIEQVEGNRWVAEVEAGGFPGGPNFKRAHLSALSYEDIMGQVSAAYYAQVPPVVTREPLTFSDVDVGETARERFPNIMNALAESERAEEPAPKRRGRPPKVDGDTVVE